MKRRGKTTILLGLGVLTATILFLLAKDGLPGSTFRYDPAKAVHSKLSGDQAFEHVKTIVAFGQRHPGSDGILKSRGYIRAELAKVGWFMRGDTFGEESPRGHMKFTNLHARLGKDDSAFSSVAEVIVGSHYDTKDMPGRNFVGANDGGSSTGLLIEMARALATNPDLAKRIELVFFDGEEAVKPHITATDGLYGSRHLAEKLRVLPKDERPPSVVIFDMIGDVNLDVGIPSNTDREMTQGVFKASEELGYRKFFAKAGEIRDDHLPFQDNGFRTTNIIDLNYKPYWHTSEDTIDRVSPKSLEITGRTGLLFIEKYLLGGGGEEDPTKGP